MKKIFTLLLLAAFFSMPRSAQAQIVWQIATGNEWRINPNNPGDPNDSVRLEAGTKFFYLRGIFPHSKPFNGEPADTNKIWIYVGGGSTGSNTNAYAWIENFNIKRDLMTWIGRYDKPFQMTRRASSYTLYDPYGAQTTHLLSDRLIRCFLGYDYIAYVLSSDTPYDYYRSINKYCEAVSQREVFDYYRKLIMTEEEALAITKLDLSPLSYSDGLSYPYSSYSTHTIKIENQAHNTSKLHEDLKIFKNVKELNLTNFDPSAKNGHFLKHIAEYFPKLEKLTIGMLVTSDDISNNRTPGYTFDITQDLPGLKYLEIGVNVFSTIRIENHPSLETLVLAPGAPDYYDMPSATAKYIIINNNPKLKIVDAEDAQYFKMELSNSNLDEFKTGCFGVLRCQNNNITELRVTGSSSFYPSGNGNDKFSAGGRLFCNGADGNSIGSLTLDGSNVVVMDCSNLELTNATLDIKNAPGLEFLNVSYNNIDSLDLSNCPRIKEVYCQDNGMTSLTTNAPTLRHLECQRNNISKLNISGSVSYNTYWTVLPSAGYEAGSDTYVNISPGGSRKIYQINYSSWYESEPRSVDGEVRCEKYDYFDYTARRWMHCDHRDSFEEEYYDYDAYVWDTRWIAAVTTRTEIPAPAGYTAQQVTDTIYSGSDIAYLDCSNNSPMTSLTLPGASNLKTLYCYNNNNLDALDVTACTSLQRLYMSHTKIPAIDLSNCKDLRVLYAKNRIGEPGFANWNHGLTSLDCSGLTNLQTVLLSRNKMTSLNMSGCSSLRTLTCDNQGGGNDNDSRLLETLNLTGCSNLTSLDCQNNALTSLDLSTCTKLLPNRVKGYVQRAIKDVVVLDRDKICIELPNGVTPTVAYNGTISDINMDNYFGTWAGSGYDKTRNKVVRREGKSYLVLYDIGDDARGGTQTKYDVDYYGRILKYQYALAGDNWDETLGGSLANSKKNDNVTVTIYPYVMYVNPSSKDIHSTEVTQQGKAPFYSGTIYLDYDAIVPAGATAYIAKKININKELIYSTAGGGHEKVTADQLELVPLVAGEGASEVVIPALTPVYIKSDTEFGLFSFDRNNHGGVEQALGYAQDGSDLIQDNIFRGVLQDSTITKYSVLSLGRGRPKGSDDSGYTTESRIGFWPSNNTKIPAHRVFIPMSELENAGIGSGSPGLLFSFMGNDEGTTTGIRPALINRNEGWYTINGIRLNGRPTEKGIYIHNGRKEVIR